MKSEIKTERLEIRLTESKKNQLIELKNRLGFGSLAETIEYLITKEYLFHLNDNN